MRPLRRIAAILPLVLAACGATAAPASQSAAPPTVSAPAKPAASSVGPASAATKSAASAAAASSALASAAAKPAGSGTPTKLTLALSTTSATQLPFWAAADGGYFQEHGLDVTSRLVTGGSTTTATLLSGESQVVGGGGAEGLSAATSGADIVITAVTGPRFDYIFEVTSDIKTPADLKGQRVGVPAIGGNADLAVHAALRTFGLDPDKDVAITATGAQTTSLAAVASHAVVGTMLSPPGNLTAEQQGTHPLFNMSDMDVYTTGGAVYFQRSFVTAQRAAVQGFNDAIVQAVARIKKDRAFTIGLMKKNLQLDDVPTLNSAYDHYGSNFFPSLPYPKPEYFQEAVNTLGAKNDKIKSFDLNKILDQSFIQSAADRGLDR